MTAKLKHLDRDRKPQRAKILGMLAEARVNKSRNYPLQVRFLPATAKRIEEIAKGEEVSVSKLIDIAVLHLIAVYDEKES